MRCRSAVRMLTRIDATVACRSTSWSALHIRDFLRRAELASQQSVATSLFCQRNTRYAIGMRPLGCECCQSLGRGCDAREVWLLARPGSAASGQQKQHSSEDKTSAGRAYDHFCLGGFLDILKCLFPFYHWADMPIAMAVGSFVPFMPGALTHLIGREYAQPTGRVSEANRQHGSITPAVTTQVAPIRPLPCKHYLGPLSLHVMTANCSA